MNMATKAKVSERLVAATEATPPKNPAPSGADKAYLRGLKRRGYTEDEIRGVAAKAGMQLPADFFVPKKKKPAAPAAAVK
jgi:hypothetical protein